MAACLVKSATEQNISNLRCGTLVRKGESAVAAAGRITHLGRCLDLGDGLPGAVRFAQDGQAQRRRLARLDPQAGLGGGLQCALALTRRRPRGSCGGSRARLWTVVFAFRTTC